MTHKKIDAGPLLVAPVPRSRRRTANAPLEVHLSGVRFARLLQVAAELVPKLRRLLADISRQRNFFGVVRNHMWGAIVVELSLTCLFPGA